MSLLYWNILRFDKDKYIVRRQSQYHVAKTFRLENIREISII